MFNYTLRISVYRHSTKTGFTGTKDITTSVPLSKGMMLEGYVDPGNDLQEIEDVVWDIPKGQAFIDLEQGDEPKEEPSLEFMKAAYRTFGWRIVDV